MSSGGGGGGEQLAALTNLKHRGEEAVLQHLEGSQSLSYFGRYIIQRSHSVFDVLALVGSQ